MLAFCIALCAGLLTAARVSASTTSTTGTAGTTGTSPRTAAPSVGPRPQYRCAFNVTTDAFTGAHGTASAIGWLGDHNSVITCLGGTFLVQDGPGGLFRDYGFGLYDGQRTTWADAGGYLPEQVTTFNAGGARVAISEFADRVDVGGVPFVAVYCRFHVANGTGHALTVDPAPSPQLVPLNQVSVNVAPHGAADHDYAVVADQFGASGPWPADQALAAAGGFDQHEAHMRAFWNAQLGKIAQVQVPDTALVDAYKSGFITTQLTRRGDQLNTGVNGYESEFSHDVMGILTTLFTQGYFADAHALLTEARNVVGSAGQYVDGLWTYPLPWAVYLLKTGDVAFVQQNFSADGPGGAAQPSIEASAHTIAADRTGPMGTMEATDDIDTQGYWTTDDFEALLGLAAYRFVAQTIGDTAEASWAATQYHSLLAATNTVLGQTIAHDGLHYLPCSLVQPNTANRCNNPKDANWTSGFGFGSWAWEGGLLDAPLRGPGLTQIDATYDYGFGRLRGVLPPDTTGGFPGDYYSSAYNAAQGLAGLESADHRDQGILGYDFMVAHSQSGPWSWWESSSAPDAGSPWLGSHPATGQGSSPHAWGMAGADKVLLDSIAAQRADGALIVGRGLPASWLSRAPISVANFPTTGGRRIGLTITSAGATITLTLRGKAPGPVLFQVPSFIGNIASASTGHVDQAEGSVTVPPGAHRVTVTMRDSPSG
jgi:hypothetical protein